MKTSEFNFELPDELIARYPLESRSESRLLCVDENGNLVHAIFSQLPELLKKNDVLIFNNTRVIPARLSAKKLTGGKIEILIERVLTNCTAYAHVRANKSLKLPGTVLLTDGTKVIIEKKVGDLFYLIFNTAKPIDDILLEQGEVPLPGYMQRCAELLDLVRYQTIYACRNGAVAAPTAGLHFDELLFARLKALDISFGFITLHVGAGTFKPVLAEEIADHTMHHEAFEIAPSTSELINKTKQAGGRIIAVGTTTIRALETVAQPDGRIEPCMGETNIFIYPGYRFKCVDALITNFHLPRSTLLMLVCALGGYNTIMTSYQEAIRKRYRFYSYGDAMFIPKPNN